MKRRDFFFPLGAATLGLPVWLMAQGQAARAAAPLFALPPSGAVCPVCGMQVGTAPQWLAAAGYRDGQTVYFDGPKHLFTYLAEAAHYRPDRRGQELAGSYVTDYYTVQPLDAHAALYVAGSDVAGPMGADLVALASAAEASDFRKDHHGREVIHFEQVTPQLVHGLDRGAMHP